MKKKILFIVPSMRGGGSERVISIILKNLNRDNFDIILVLLKKEGKYLEDLPADIEIIDLEITKARYSIVKIIKIILSKKPDIVFSTLGYLNILISIIRPFFSKNIKFIARESSIASIQNKQEKYPKLFDFLFKYFYKNFDLIISQSNYMKNDLVQNYKIDKDKIKVINNPIDLEIIERLSEEKLDEKVDLLAVGRLDENKNFKDIIQILPELSYNLTILGEGKEKKNLLNLAKNLGVENKVKFLGFQSNPYKYMKNAKVLILTSKYEGFPNVLLEANACGTPVIAYKCPGGTEEIIKDGLNGFLVKCGNINELKKKIQIVYRYNWKKNNIEKYINDCYSVKKIIKEYEKELNDL